MRKLLSITIGLLVVISCKQEGTSTEWKSQKSERRDSDSNNEVLFAIESFNEKYLSMIKNGALSPAKEDDQLSIPIACGIAGYTSPEILNLKELHRSGNYAAVRQKLFDGSHLERLVVVVMLTEYQVRKKVVLVNAELEKIAAIKRSKQPYALCYTCTVHIEGTVIEIFSRSSSKTQPLFSAYDLIRQAVLE